MPIRIDRFEEDDESELRPGGHTNAELVLAFLSANDEQAFTPKEIHEEVEIARGSVGVVLSRLEDRELVRHRGEYWAADPDADVATTLTSLATARNATERFGPEDSEDWGPGVGEDT
ncbi:MarR family transcriptional regulator [Salinarchaeum laminariae]|uniref:MarR family transcriptional regulator n=1 Tax=Salinarchaeum laminariae TaxID=869888 RepID=UPI0020BE5A28|nr:helix-turn-helix domain-containing protein [Salinarchaeum laminariae]